MTNGRARIDLSDFDAPPPSKDPAVLREISETNGFPSRQPAPPAPAPVAERPLATSGFQRPVKTTGSRNIAINVRVNETTAARIYELRDAEGMQRRTLADVIDDAIEQLYAKEFPDGAAQ